MITGGGITPGTYQRDSRQLVERVRTLSELGLSAIQVREKLLDAAIVCDLASRIANAVSDTDTLVIVNDRFDIALVSGADGVHLTGRSMNAGVVRASVPDEFLIGVSTHTFPEVKAAKTAGADFAVFGPVFHSPGKAAPTGTSALSEAVSAGLGMPVVALGGVDRKNFSDAVDAGAGGIAAIRLFVDEENAREVLEQMSWKAAVERRR